MFNSRLSRVSPDGLFREVPKLMIGFDTETTGLWKPPLKCECQEHSGQGGIPSRLCLNTDPEEIKRRDFDFTPGADQRKDYKDGSIHEPITYGFALYKDGKIHGPKETFVVKPGQRALEIMMADPERWARNTHKWDDRMLKSAYAGGHTKLQERGEPDAQGMLMVRTTNYKPGMDRITGMRRAIEKLGDFQRQGAVIVGANVTGFDLSMLKHHFENATNTTMESAGFDLDKAIEDGKILDVIRHHWDMEGRPTGSSGRPVYRKLSDGIPNPYQRGAPFPKKKDTLSEIYRVEQGNHSAAEDARASLDVAVRQILTNQGNFTPSQLELG
jgi:hypothetical protein